MAVDVNPQILMQLAESLTIEGVSSTAFQLVWEEFNRTGNRYNATSTPPVTKVAGDKLALTAGAATIDLTALTGSGGAVTFDGIKPVLLLLKNPSTNAGASISLAEGATNGYPIPDLIVYRSTGRSGWTFLDFCDALTDVSGTDKTIDVTGTVTDELHYVIVGG